MASTGDLRNNIEKLKKQLKSIQYSGVFDVEGFVFKLLTTQSLNTE